MKTQYLEKLRDLTKKQKGEVPVQPAASFEGDNLESFIEHIKNVPRQKPVYRPERSGQLKEVVDNFDREELAEFLEAALLESPELTALPLFEVTKAFSAADAAFDWLMDMSYTTLVKAAATFEVLFERAMDKDAYGSKGYMVLQKIMAITARNHAGLPFGYLKRKVQNAEINPELQLRMALLMLQHQDCNLDVKELTELFNVQQRPWLLPAQMEAQLPLSGQQISDREKAANQAFQALELLPYFDNKSFPVKDFDLFHPMTSVLEIILGILKNAYRNDWEEQLKSFYERPGFVIANDWLRNRVEETFLYSSMKEMHTAVKVAHDNEVMVEFTLDILTFETIPSAEEIKDWVNSALLSKKGKEELIQSIVLALQYQGELAAANMKPLLESLKQNHINMEEELKAWRVAVRVEQANYEVETANMRYQKWVSDNVEPADLEIKASIKSYVRSKQDQFKPSKKVIKDVLLLADDYKNW
ncbi:MAG: hypothetical protein SH848_19385 [Saprospiraceae bacterium]|nr:hypothetical protein [Saprospiraceae bacterium]